MILNIFYCFVARIALYTKLQCAKVQEMHRKHTFCTLIPKQQFFRLRKYIASVLIFATIKE